MIERPLEDGIISSEEGSTPLEGELQRDEYLRDNLNPGQMQTLQERMKGKTHEEIAQELNISKTTVGNRLAKAGRYVIIFRRKRSSDK